MYEYKVTFTREHADRSTGTITVVIDSVIEPELLILEGDYSYGEYEFVQECLTALEDRARGQFDTLVGLHDFTSVTCPDGTVVEPT